MNPEITVFLATKLHVVIMVTVLVYTLFLHKEKRNQTLLLALLTLPMAFIFGKVASLFIDNPRPFVVEGITPLIQHIADNGFPSDHTLLTATVACIIFVHNKALGSILLGLSILVGVSRVLAGVHHYLDVAGSVLIAGIATYLATVVIRHQRLF
jgi:undecaprenyl-diphosphatase